MYTKYVYLQYIFFISMFSRKPQCAVHVSRSDKDEINFDTGRSFRKKYESDHRK